MGLGSSGSCCAAYSIFCFLQVIRYSKTDLKIVLRYSVAQFNLFSFAEYRPACWSELYFGLTPLMKSTELQNMK